MTTAREPLTAALIDLDEQQTGIRKAGLINSVLTLASAPVVSTQLTIFMGILHIFGYRSDLPIQSAHTMLGIRIGVSVIPLVFLFFGLLCLRFFPIDLEAEGELSRYSQERRREESIAEE